MNRTLTWVIGAGGLLGSHLLQAIVKRGHVLVPWHPESPRIPWENQALAASLIAARARAFVEAVRAGGGAWTIAWGAGAGVVGTTSEALASETSYLKVLLETISPCLREVPGRFLLASSAGGVYGNNPDQPLTETSACRPISAYGRNKLSQEHLLQSWASDMPLVSILVARLSNLYGPGQNLQKPQGLIAHLSRSLLHHRPVHLYVPLDTMRDYLYVSDAAEELVLGLERLGEIPRTSVVRIFCAGQTVTIARILGIYARIAKRQPRIICSVDPVRTLQPDRLQFRSTIWNDMTSYRRTDLATGILRVHQYQLDLFQQGRLPPPMGH